MAIVRIHPQPGQWWVSKTNNRDRATIVSLANLFETDQHTFVVFLDIDGRTQVRRLGTFLDKYLQV